MATHSVSTDSVRVSDDLEAVKDFPRRAAAAATAFSAEIEAMEEIAERLAEHGYREAADWLAGQLGVASWTSVSDKDYVDRVAEAVRVLGLFGSNDGAFNWWLLRVNFGDSLATIARDHSEALTVAVLAFEARFAEAYPAMAKHVGDSAQRKEIEAAIAELVRRS